MATIDRYKIKIDVEGQQAVENLKTSLGGLGTLIAGIGFGAFIGNAMRMADALGDVANAAGLSVGYVKGLSEAIEQAGGDFADAGKMIGVFYDKLEQGATGAEAAQETLKRVGIGLNELRTLSEQQLFDRAITKLGEMEAGAQRTALGVELFGKAFRTVDPKVLDEILRTKDFNALTTEMKAAADAIDAMEQNYRKLQDAALKVLGPLIGEVDKLRLTSEQAEKIIKIFAIGMATAFGAQVLANIVLVTQAVITLGKALKATALIQSTMVALTGPKGWAMVAAAVATATGGLYAYNKLLEDVEKNTGGATGSWDDAGPPMPGRPAFPDAKAITDQEAKARRDAADAARAQTEQLAKQNEEARRYQAIITNTIGMDEEHAKFIQQNAQINKDANDKIFAIQQQISKEKKNERGVNHEVIKQLQKQIELVEIHRENMLIELGLQRQLIANEKIRNQDLEYRKNLILEEQAGMDAVDEVMRNIAIHGQTLQTQIENTFEESRLTPFYATLRRIATQQNDYGEALKRSLAPLLQNDPERMAAAFITIDSMIAENIKKLQEQRLAVETVQTSFSDGWTKAFNNFIMNSTNAATIAQQSFNTLTNNMNSAIDNFVRTGKFKFSDFARSVIQDLIAIQLKAQAAEVLKGGSNILGGIGRAIAGMLGFANGGQPPVNRPSIVGENGPEIFIPKTAGTVVSNEKSFGNQNAGQNVYITNNISAVDAKSVAQLFAENRKTLLGTVRLAQKEIGY